jgi:hypothetical protein
VLLVAGCGAIDRTQPAHGEETSVIVVAIDSLWSASAEDVRAALEPRLFTVRDEKAFEVTHVSPASEDWLELRRFKQVLVVGTAADGWVGAALGDTVVAAPVIVERPDVWARGQVVTAVVVPAESSLVAFKRLLPELGRVLDDRFRAYVHARMFSSDANTALRDSLAAVAGFSVLLPNIYRPEQSDGAYVFRSAPVAGSQLARVIVIAWRDELNRLTADEVLDWRDRLAPLVFSLPQETGRERVETRALDGRAAGSLEVHGVWTSRDASWPAAGPFLDRVVLCPEQRRTYFLEAWLYAPGRAKYEYMIQFQRLLDSFECGRAAA